MLRSQQKYFVAPEYMEVAASSFFLQITSLIVWKEKPNKAVEQPAAKLPPADCQARRKHDRIKVGNHSWISSRTDRNSIEMA